MAESILLRDKLEPPIKTNCSEVQKYTTTQEGDPVLKRSVGPTASMSEYIMTRGGFSKHYNPHRLHICCLDKIRTPVSLSYSFTEPVDESKRATTSTTTSHIEYQENCPKTTSSKDSRKPTAADWAFAVFSSPQMLVTPASCHLSPLYCYLSCCAKKPLKTVLKKDLKNKYSVVLKLLRTQCLASGWELSKFIFSNISLRRNAR